MPRDGAATGALRLTGLAAFVRGGAGLALRGADLAALRGADLATLRGAAFVAGLLGLAAFLAGIKFSAA
jgi:hypothetical protein